jgi:hypothetical protein
MTNQTDELAGQLWTLAGGGPDVAARLTLSGPRTFLPSDFDVTGLATASVAAATLAAAEYQAARNDSPVAAVRVDSGAACAAFAAEGLFAPVGWSLPDIWDPIAGNYQARDGWIRLHTNYASHRAAVTGLLKADDRDSVQAAVAQWKAGDLEAAVVAAGGCAAAMHARDGWHQRQVPRPRPRPRSPSPSARWPRDPVPGPPRRSAAPAARTRGCGCST